MRILDANIFVRYFTGDDALKEQKSREIIERLRDGLEEAITTEIIVHETCFVLTSSRHYNRTHQEVRDLFYPLIQMSALHVANKSVCLEALDIFSESEKIDFSDSFSIALVRNGIADGIYSFDERMGKVEGSNIVDPRYV